MQIEAVILSHMHWDHIGCLLYVIAAKPGVDVYAPAAFSRGFLRDVRARAHAVVETRLATRVAEHVWTTEVLQDPFLEQALYVDSAEGIVVVTGCAHPGVVELVRSAQRVSDKTVHAVLGGFHMTGMGQGEIAQVVDGLRDLGVHRVGPCHCSGDAARDAMREAFGSDYLDIGVGSQLSFAAPESVRSIASEDGR